MKYFKHAVTLEGQSGFTIVLDSPTVPSDGNKHFDSSCAWDYVPPLSGSVSPQNGASLESAGIPFNSARPSNMTYRDTPLPFSESSFRLTKDAVPEKILEMRKLFQYSGESPDHLREENFYRQAVFMQDFEDDFPWEGNFVRYFPTYQDLTVRQLRGYFTWRTQVRRSNFQPIAASAAYLYVYELLNGVGAVNPEDCLLKLKAFEAGFLDSGYGDRHMHANLQRWMLEYAVLHNLPPELARQAADPVLIERDTALSVLRNSAKHSDDEVFSALCLLGEKKTAESPVLGACPERGKHLFSEAWRAASVYTREDPDYRARAAGRSLQANVCYAREETQNLQEASHSSQEKDLFTLCFGERILRSWYPLYNAIYYRPAYEPDRDYVLDDCRSYHCRHGIWKVNTYEKLSFNRKLLQGFLHETDARLRQYLKTHRYLRENPADAWAVPYIDAVINADRRAVLEVSRPRITIDLSDLDQIRKDAEITRDSLLTDEELLESAADQGLAEESRLENPSLPTVTVSELLSSPMEVPASETVFQPGLCFSLDSVQLRILTLLLRGNDTAGLSALLKENHLMPSIAADQINEALFDDLGDTALLCDNDRLSLVEDYREDLMLLLGLS